MQNVEKASAAESEKREPWKRPMQHRKEKFQRTADSKAGAGGPGASTLLAGAGGVGLVLVGAAAYAYSPTAVIDAVAAGCSYVAAPLAGYAVAVGNGILGRV